MTAQEQLDYLMAQVWQPSDAEVTIGMIRDESGLTQEQYALVRGTLDTAIATLKADPDPSKRAQGLDLQDALAAMLSRGISLSTENRQATIDLLAMFGSWPDAVRDAVKALGGVWRHRWQVEGYPAEPTLSALTKRQIVDDTRSRINAKATAINAWLDAVDLESYEESQLQEYCDSLLASADGNPVSGGD